NIGTGGTLVMTNTADSLEVVQGATFGGNSTAGLLTAGTLILDGDFTQTGDPKAFAPSGTHLTVFNPATRSGGVTHAISFSNPTTSTFQDLREDYPDTLSIFNGEADVHGTLTVNHAALQNGLVIRSGLGNGLLRFGTADVHAAVFDTVTAQFLRTTTPLVAFDSVTFNAPTDGFTQFMANGHAGDTLTISNTVFTTVGTGTGNYISATNLDGTGLFTVLALLPNLGSAEFNAHILPDPFSTIVWDVP
ncbi:MAG TPA: hypothetical protein VFU45_06155, partial [Gemmatimonadales bacterium]|nr:hypothetical protein [Gemmatimonadales bacterium]